MKRLVSSYFLSESAQGERSGIACICFLLFIYVISAVYSHYPIPAKCPSRTHPVTIQSHKSGLCQHYKPTACKFSEVDVKRGSSRNRCTIEVIQSRNFSGGFVKAGFDALVNSFPAQQKAGRQISRFYQIPSENR